MPRILLFTKTTGFRHGEAIERGVELIQERAAANNVEVVHTEDSSAFAPSSLTDFDATVWLQVSGDVLEEDQRRSLANFLELGGGFAGIHAASDAERGWPDFVKIVGSRFLYHPANQAQGALLTIENPDHPSTAGLASPWEWTDEWYVFEHNPRGEVDVLLTIDESTYDTQAEKMGSDHPLSWKGSFGAGRTWYTALGHYPKTYGDSNFRSHIWGGVRSVVKALD